MAEKLWSTGLVQVEVKWGGSRTEVKRRVLRPRRRCNRWLELSTWLKRKWYFKGEKTRCRNVRTTSIKRSIEHDPGESYTYQGNRISIRERTLTQRSVKKSVEVEDDTDCGETAIKRIGSSCGEMGRITNRSEEKAKRMQSPSRKTRKSYSTINQVAS